jgi:hypothetical protein
VEQSKIDQLGDLDVEITQMMLAEGTAPSPRPDYIERCVRALMSLREAKARCQGVADGERKP